MMTDGDTKNNIINNNMRPKKYDDIPNIDTPWVDYSGKSVEKLIKQEILKRCGWLFRSKATKTKPSYLYGFTDEDAYIKWSYGEEVSPIFQIALPGGDVYSYGISGVNIGLSDTDIKYGDDIKLIVSYDGTYTTNNITGVTTQTYHDVYVVVRRSLGDELRYYEIKKIKYEEFVNNRYNIKDYIDNGFTNQYFKVSLVDKVTGVESDITTLEVNVTFKLVLKNVTQHEYPIGNTDTFSFIIDGDPVDKVLHVDIESKEYTGTKSLTYNITGDYSVNPFKCDISFGFMNSHEFKMKSWVTGYSDVKQYTSDVVTTWFYYENPDQGKERVEFTFNIENEKPKYYKVGEPAHICDFVIYNGSSDTAEFYDHGNPGYPFNVQLSGIKANTVYSIAPVINKPTIIYKCDYRFIPGHTGSIYNIKVTIEN